MDLSKLASNKSTKKISGKLLQLDNKNLYIQFQIEVNSIKILAYLLQCFQNFLTFQFTSVITFFDIVLKTTQKSYRVSSSLSVQLYQYRISTKEASIYDENNQTSLELIDNTNQSQYEDKSYLKKRYRLTLLLTLNKREPSFEQSKDWLSYNREVLYLDSIIDVYTYKGSYFYNVLKVQLFNNYYYLKGREITTISIINKSHNLNTSYIEFRLLTRDSYTSMFQISKNTIYILKVLEYKSSYSRQL